MELFQLEAFLAVVREGSFSAAAKALYRTQPAISQTIKKLEDEKLELDNLALGVLWLRRGSRK